MLHFNTSVENFGAYRRRAYFLRLHLHLQYSALNYDLTLTEQGNFYEAEKGDFISLCRLLLHLPG